jgi:DUF177 domain-containing protein
VKLRIEDITAQAKELRFAEPESEVNRVLGQGSIAEYHVDGPMRVEVAYYRAGTELFFAGTLSADVTAQCARCAEEFSATVARPFKFILTPRVVGYEKRNDLGLEDLELSLYDGDEVDLSPLIREQQLLALPTRPLCRDDCRGLCPQCGVNLNRTQCGCTAPAGDPRLAVLRSLKLGRA